MNLIEGIRSRASAAKLGEPSPTQEQLRTILEAGLRAPDHGRLKPWRFVVLEGTARSKLGDAMANLLKKKAPQSTPAQLDGERAKPMRAPTIIVVAARIMKGKIPEIEQIAAEVEAGDVGRGQVDGGQGGERAAVSTHRGPYRLTDDDVGHGSNLVVTFDTVKYPFRRH